MFVFAYLVLCATHFLRRATPTMSAAAAAAMQRPSCARSRLCFHCGEPGHRAKDCPSGASGYENGTGSSSGTAQTKAGQEAFARYLQCRKERAAEREERRQESNHSTEESMKTKGPLHHFHRVVEWMDNCPPATTPAMSSLHEPRDPMAVLHADGVEAASSSLNTTQRWNDLHKAKWNDVEKAHREVFDHYIQDIRFRLASSLGVTPEDEAASTWHAKLSEAVNLGRPADFSSQSNGDDDGDGSAILSNKVVAGRLSVYAVEKLNARSRQLYRLLFDDCSISAKLRSLLLPSASSDSGSCNDCADSARPINVVSLGGGPGYDHVAISIAAKFFYRIQPHFSQFETRRIRTQVFDLFDEDWKHTMATLGKCTHQSFMTGDRDGDSSDYNDISMHHCDIRKGLQDGVHSDLATAVETVDIICVQFVLHENSSFILNEGKGYPEEGATLSGAMQDIFDRSPLGCIMIVCDSSNALFPALKNTAKRYGWKYWGDDEQRGEGQKIGNLGPKSFVLLEKVA